MRAIMFLPMSLCVLVCMSVSKIAHKPLDWFQQIPVLISNHPLQMFLFLVRPYYNKLPFYLCLLVSTSLFHTQGSDLTLKLAKNDRTQLQLCQNPPYIEKRHRTTYHQRESISLHEPVLHKILINQETVGQNVWKLGRMLPNIQQRLNVNSPPGEVHIPPVPSCTWSRCLHPTSMQRLHIHPPGAVWRWARLQ